MKKTGGFKLGNTFSEFFRNFKKFSDREILKKKRMSSDSEILNYLFRPLIMSKAIKNKNGDLLDFDKSRVSRILNNKDNVPITISDEYSFLKTNDEIKDSYISLFKECISDSNVDCLLSVLGFNGDNKYETLYVCFVESLITNNKNSENDNSILIWENGCNSIRFISGNIFGKCFKRKTDKSIIVIPINSAFDVHVSTKLENINPLVSSQTLHGQWIQKCKSTGFIEEEIQEKIRKFLNVQCSNQPSDGKYPIGTIVPFATSKGTSYLLAIADFDEYNVAHSTKENIEKSIEKLIEFYDKNGQGYPLYIPLMGTGRSRVNLSYQQSFELIKGTLIDNKEHIQGNIYIIALPEVYEKLREG